MSARDRTQLAALGFADLDKKNNLHDLACQYLCGESIQCVLQQQLLGDRPITWCKTEFPLSKGEAQYKTTIGFLDVLYCVGGPYTPRSCDWGFLITEVKVTPPLALGDVLRQIHLYREYWPNLGFAREWNAQGYLGAGNLSTWRSRTQWLLATTFPLLEDDVAFLHQDGLNHVYLGKKFQEWVAERRRRVETCVDTSGEILL